MMPPKEPTNARSSAGRKSLIWGGLALGVAAVIYVAWPSSTVTLDEPGYDVAVALYRACNQKNIEAVKHLDQRMEDLFLRSGFAGDLRQTGPSDDAQHRALQQIVNEAQQGRWEQAMVSCRDLLQDQVR